MKLRNKNTGEIVDAWSFYDGNETVNLKYFTDDGQVNLEYRSLAELNEEWEDYKPAEPLIKDEKVRKAVRAWAEASEVNPQVIKASIGTRCTDFIGWRKYETHGIGIGFRNPAGIENIADGEPYTLAELCGEDAE